MQNYLVITAPPDKKLCEKWEDLLCHSAFASHYVTADFFDDPFVGEGQRFAVIASEGEKINAVMTGSIENGVVTSGLPVRPQIAFRDGADSADIAKALIDGLHSVVGSGPSLIRLYSWEAIDGFGRSGYQHSLCHGGDQVLILDCAKGPEALFKAFSERRRTDIRKVIKKAELIVKLLETESELAELYTVHLDWCERKSIKPDDLVAFHVNLNRIYRTVLIAIHDGKVVAGTYLRYCKGGLVEYAANNSLTEYNHLRPNELLGWRAIEWVCENGFSKFSLGASHPFLTRFGDEIVATHRYQLDRTFLRLHTNRERAMRLAVKTFQALPDPVRQRIKAAAARG